MKPIQKDDEGNKLQKDGGVDKYFDNDDDEENVDFIKYFFKKMKKKASNGDTYKSKVSSLKSILKKESKYSVKPKAISTKNSKENSDYDSGENTIQQENLSNGSENSKFSVAKTFKSNGAQPGTYEPS